ncbi:hypothetical protein CMI47_01150 [Candidatus Pacearchaeota archaeon]|nr:hypothetical protein [Candidatus Pacearchaeota archaeon]|tara:strand:- start:2705 stop:3124 length:420 start_codon:yes stop_codon:yes gene_type:complete
MNFHENFPHRIDVSDIDPWSLLAALFNASRTSKTSVCFTHSLRAPGNTITPDQAKAEAQDNVREEYHIINGAPFWPDYIYGRPIKAMLQLHDGRMYLVRTNFYDRDVGEGAASRVVHSLLPSGSCEVCSAVVPCERCQQ